ncbi:MAG TPA: DUF4386 domain-containing protein [Pyrinomonadaceae bacterium]
MRSAKSTGRTIGVLLLLQMACGLVVPFVLWHPLILGSPAFLPAAAASSFQIRAGVFLSFVGAALTVAIAITAWSIIRRYSETMALWFLVVCAISCTLDAMQNATVMSMLSVSQEYVKAGTSDAALAGGVGTVVATTRRWVHYTQLLGFGAWISLFYLSLLRFDLVPRALAILGLIGILLQFTGVTLLAFLGYSSMTQLAMPLAPIHIANGLWLIVKGFKEPHLSLPTEAQIGIER